VTGAPFGPGRRPPALLALERHLRQIVERLLERPALVHVGLQRERRCGADGRHAVDVEPVAAPELELEPLEAAPLGGLGALGHVVGVAEPDGPRGGRAGAKQPEKTKDNDGMGRLLDQ
jgi:hypothetical protein